MADAADMASDLYEEFTSQRESEVRKAASSIPEGNPGDCDLCGEWSGRLVGGACAPCRDAHNLP